MTGADRDPGLIIELYRPPKPYRVRRSWPARLLTWPWRPWIAATLVTPPSAVSPHEAYRIGNRIVAGALFYNSLKAAIPIRREDRHGSTL